MADTTKIVGQSNPSATTLTDLYAVPAATNFAGAIYVANRSGTPTTFRISLAPAGAVDALSQYIAYDVAIGANDVKEFTNIALNATDKIRVYATLATLTFTATGVEVA
jgi:hypothetical protein